MERIGNNFLGEQVSQLLEHMKTYTVSANN